MDGDFTLNPGNIVAGKYQIIDTLGVGGSGAVYRAQKLGRTQQVALKMMHAEHPDGDNERARFAREAELVKRLQHPHIVRLMDYGHADDGVPFLAFALLTGQPLEDKIKNEGALDHPTVGRFSQQALRALDKAHSLHVVHRDIKPANIFLSNGVLGEVVQMLDFGLAKLVHDADADEAMDVTRVGSVMGTPRYMAPEQVRGEQVGPTADIYSFGLVMAEMLIGRPLVGGKEQIEIYVSQGSDQEHQLPTEITDSPFAAIVKRAIAKPLNVRYRQASQMLADVNAVVEALSGGQEVMSEADMEATFVMDVSKLLALSTPSATSGKLHAAFNAMAARQAKQKAKSARPAAPSPAAPSLPPAAPPPLPRPSAPPRPAAPPQRAAPPTLQVPPTHSLAQTIPPQSSNGAIAAQAAISYAAPMSSHPRPAFDTGPKIVVNAPLSSHRPQRPSAPPGSATIPGSGPATIPSSGPATIPGSAPAIIPGSGPGAIPGTGPATIPGTSLPSTPAPPIPLDATLSSASSAPVAARSGSIPPKQRSLAPDEVTPTDLAPVFALARRRRRVALIIAVTIIVIVTVAATAVWVIWLRG